MPPPSNPLDDLARLGLPPGAPADALKPAWRRAVSALHPDRNGPGADRALADVNAAYQRLHEFARRHGRLPGRTDARIPPPPTAQPKGRRWAVGALALVAGIVVLWPQAEPNPLQPSTPLPEEAEVLALPPDPVPPPADAATDAHRETLRLGLAPSDVERLAGEPLFKSDERWVYGPSEIRFTHGRVSGWYSSPLRPLPVDGPARVPDATAE